MCKISQIPTTVFLVRAIQTVLVSITDVGVVNAAMVRTQEVIRRACCDGGICQRQHSHSVFSHNIYVFFTYWMKYLSSEDGE